MEERSSSSVASDPMELFSSITYFSTKQPKSWRYMLKCVTGQPAGSPGPHTFTKIQENLLLY
jgi:hypothetical protein